MDPESRATGIVRWFSDQKCYGFITPEDGSEDLFVHQSSIKSDGFRSLKEGDLVEFSISVGENNKTKAIDVTGPDGAAISDNRWRGGGRRGGAGFSSGGNCYNCGRPGHLARECVDASSGGGSGACYNCGETGHFSRDCTSGGGGGGGSTACYNCGEVGHFSRDCTSGGGGGSSTACYNCGEAGHFSRDCASVGGGGGGGRGSTACYNCGGFGHFARECKGGGGGTSTAACYNCGLPGHLARDCLSV